MPAFAPAPACPTAETLLAFKSDLLPPGARRVVSFHLTECDFCCASLHLLAHHREPQEMAPPLAPASVLAKWLEDDVPQLPRQQRAA